MKAESRKLRAFEIADLIGKRDASGEAWIEFLRVPALSMGVYALAAGADDPQTGCKQRRRGDDEEDSREQLE